jgi:alkanesulfonate monooxygenase SsuD/methylene tetrahydromethanopterin reductase-like flavin-dependent oxidoreductase (luciferase family)
VDRVRDRVRVGANPSFLIGGAEPERAAAGLTAMAAAGVDHVVIGDHVSFFVGIGFDGLIQATALAMLHPTLPVYTSVYLLPLRHPVAVARQLSTLAGIAPGRLVFGVGIGGEDRHEVEICGVDPATRGARMEECLQLLRGLLTGRATSHRGRFFDVEDAVILPAPDPAIPIVVGGRSDAAVRRAGHLGDGWVGIWVSPQRFRAAVAVATEEAQGAGRGPVAWRHGMTVWCGFADDRGKARDLLASAMQAVYQLPFERFERYCPYGSAEDVAEFLAPYVESGCRDVNLLARGSDETVVAVGDVKRLLTGIVA